MDNKNVIAMTLGIGAVGSILAFYGFNQLNGSSSEAVCADNTGDISTKKVNTTDDVTTPPNCEANKPDIKSVKADVSKEFTNAKLQVQEKWSKFWNNEYEKDQSNETGTI